MRLMILLALAVLTVTCARTVATPAGTATDAEVAETDGALDGQTDAGTDAQLSDIAAEIADVAPDGADAAIDALAPWQTTCLGLFTCLDETCKKPPPPPENGIPPPPIFPHGATVECLATCAGKIVGKERPLALALANCAQTHCDDKTCKSVEDPTNCVENCIWQNCEAELTECPNKFGFGGCASALACSWSTPAYNMQSLLACGESAEPTAANAYVHALDCSLAQVDGAPGCAEAIEACACDLPPSVTGTGSCFSAIVRGRLGTGPCGQALHVKSLRADSQNLFMDLGQCLGTACSACTDAACISTCAAQKCSAAFVACLIDAPGKAPGSGSGSCTATVPCLNECRTLRSDGCYGQCASTMTASAWSAWQDYLLCDFSHCHCTGKDPKCDEDCRSGPCKSAWQGCTAN